MIEFICCLSYTPEFLIMSFTFSLPMTLENQVKIQVVKE